MYWSEVKVHSNLYFLLSYHHWSLNTNLPTHIEHYITSSCTFPCVCLASAQPLICGACDVRRAEVSESRLPGGFAWPALDTPDATISVFETPYGQKAVSTYFLLYIHPRAQKKPLCTSLTGTGPTARRPFKPGRFPGKVDRSPLPKVMNLDYGDYCRASVTCQLVFGLGLSRAATVQGLQRWT